MAYKYDVEKKPNISRLKRSLSVLKKKNKKYVSLDMLSKWIGLYPDVLAEDLVRFSPMLLMDPTINLNDLVPAIEEYLEEESAKTKKSASPKAKRVIAKKGEVGQYASVSDFIYKKMAGPGGLISPSATLDDHDLHILEILVKNEVKARKNKAIKQAKKKK